MDLAEPCAQIGHVHLNLPSQPYLSDCTHASGNGFQFAAPYVSIFLNQLSLRTRLFVFWLSHLKEEHGNTRVLEADGTCSHLKSSLMFLWTRWI